MTDLNIYLAGLRGQLSEVQDMGDIVGRKGDGAAGHALAEKIRKALEPYVKGRSFSVRYSPRFGASILIAFSSAPKGSPELAVLNSTHRLHLWIRNPRGDSREEWNDTIPEKLTLDVQKLSYKGKLKPRGKTGTAAQILTGLVNFFKKNGKAMVEEGVHHALGFELVESKAKISVGDIVEYDQLSYEVIKVQGNKAMLERYQGRFPERHVVRLDDPKLRATGSKLR